MEQDIIQSLIKRFAKLPGLGPSSAKRLVLHLLQDKKGSLDGLIKHLQQTSKEVKNCSVCGNLDAQDPCRICQSHRKSPHQICIVEQVSDLWAMERTATFWGYYHVLGGALSPLDGITPSDLRIHELIERCQKGGFKEVIIATSATVDGVSTAHYITSQLNETDINVSALAQGVPLGGELDWLDDGTISAAFKARFSMKGKNSKS